MNFLLQSSTRIFAFLAIALPVIATAQPPNDLCTGAVIEPLAAGATVTRTGDSNGATDEVLFGAPQVWEAFSSVECLDVTVDLCTTNPIFGDSFVNLVLGCPITNIVNTGDFNQFECGDGNVTVHFMNLPPGVYYFPVIATFGAIGPYTIHFTGTACATPPPVNDECDGAIALLPSAMCVPGTYDVAGATQSLPASLCGGFTGDANDDVWFSFVATSTTHTIGVEPSSNYNAVVELYEGDCLNLVPLTCADDAASGGPESIVANGLVAGSTYYFRVYDWYAGQAATTTIGVCVLEPGPDNDFCSNVSPVSLTVGTPQVFNGTTVGATASLDAVQNSALDDGIPKVWHAFTTVECTNLLISYCGSLNTNATVFDEVYGFLANDCPSDGVQIFAGFDPSCGDGNYEVTYMTVPAGTYYMPVGLFGSGSTGDYEITITATACPPPPPNDDCANATPLPLNLVTDCPANSIAGSTTTATQDAGDPSCESALGTYQDVWYTFNSGSNATVTINLDPGTMASWAMVVSLGCGGTEVYCETDDLAPAVITVDPNTDYTVRVYTNTEFASGGDFAICATADFPTSVRPLGAEGWRVYPNPSDGGLTITSRIAGGPVDITLLDMVGREVYTEHTSIVNGASHPLPLRGRLAPGVYSLQVTAASGRWEQRIVIR